MVRNIKYKPITQDLERMVKPSATNARSSLGLEKSVGEYYFISVEDLIPYRNQARILFDDGEILQLAESIKNHGIIQPLTIISSSDNKYEVISGERRLRAAKVAGLTRVPCVIGNDNIDAEAVALIENIHRKDLTPLELGIVYKKLLENNVFASQVELTKKISVSKSQVSEYIKYANFSEEIQKFIIDNKIIAREKLRGAVKAYELGNIEKVKKILGINKQKAANLLVLRIAFTEGQMKFQDQGVKKLSLHQKTQLKNYLTNIIENI